MKLYDFATAPSPRRVRIFLAEKGVDVPRVPVDLRAGEQFQPPFRGHNPLCTVPYLELDDGSGIGEVVAICRYLEEMYPQPALFGTDAKSRGLIAMWDHRVEVEGMMAVAEALRNAAPFFKGHALPGPHGFEQIPELANRGRARVQIFFDMLNERLLHHEFVAGDTFSIADITALVAVEFARVVKAAVPDEHTSLKRWHAAISARPSAQA